MTSGLSVVSNESALHAAIVTAAASTSAAPTTSRVNVMVFVMRLSSSLDCRWHGRSIMSETEIHAQHPDTRRRQLHEIVHCGIVALGGDFRIPALELGPRAEVASR